MEVKAKRPVEILFVIDSLWGAGGAEVSLLHLIERLPPDRYHCRVLTFHTDAEARPFVDRFPCTVEHWPMVSLHHSSTARLAWTLSRLIRDQHIELVHTFFPVSDIWAAPIAKLSGARVIISSRRDMGILRRRWHGLAYRVMNPLYDQVHAVSESVRTFSIETDRVDPARALTIYNGVDARIAARNGECAELRGRLKLQTSEPLITTVANIKRIKGIDVFLRAAAQLRKQIPSLRFAIAGVFGTNNEDVTYKLEIQELSRELNLQESVVFLGACTQVPDLLKLSDVFVLSSRSEGFSNALLEAMMCGIPAVASDVGGNAELLLHGVTGLLVEPDNPAALVAAISNLLADDHLRTSMGVAARARVIENFSVQAMVARITAAYEGALSVH